MTTVEISLPDAFAREAQDAGLLAPGAIEALLRDAMRQRCVDRLFEVRNQLQASPIEPMTAEEIEAEIRAAREVARRCAAGGSHSG